MKDKIKKLYILEAGPEFFSFKLNIINHTQSHCIVKKNKKYCDFICASEKRTDME